jgi:hypothetical protein
MPHNFILQCITISIRTLSNYVREKKNIKQKNNHLYRVVPPPGTNAPLPRRRGDGTFVPGRGSTQYKCEAFVPSISPGTNAQPHLYQMVCIGWIPNTNVGYQLVQMHFFLAVFHWMETGQVAWVVEP